MFIRKLLISLLGFKRYLRLISFVFIQTYLTKLYLKEHFQVRFLSKLVSSGDACLDIGANLGYFTVPLSQLVGNEGKVMSVEPVPMFREILMKNAAYYGKSNVQIIPYALGDQDDKKIKMGTPRVDGVIRHGRTEVMEEAAEDTAQLHEAIMFTPKTLFENLEKLNFVKCDVEGYEIYIIPHFLEIFAKFQPIIEIEVGPSENKKQIIELLDSIHYSPFYLKEEKLYPFDLQNKSHQEEIELYFLMKQHKTDLSDIVKG